MTDHTHTFAANTINEIMKQHYLPALNRQLYGRPVHTDPNVPPGTLYGIGQAIYANPRTIGTLTDIDNISGISDLLRGRLPDKEPEMTTLDKIRAERREAHERERINYLYNAYDNAHLDDRDDGTVLRFDGETHGETHTYAALFVAGGWYVTGRETPNGLATEDFVAWLIGRDVEVEDLEELSP